MINIFKSLTLGFGGEWLSRAHEWKQGNQVEGSRDPGEGRADEPRLVSPQASRVSTDWMAESGKTQG